MKRELNVHEAHELLAGELEALIDVFRDFHTKRECIAFVEEYARQIRDCDEGAYCVTRKALRRMARRRKGGK